MLDYFCIYVTLCIVILADKVEFKSETQMSELKEKDEEIDALKLALKEKESKETLVVTMEYYIVDHLDYARLNSSSFTN